MNNSAAMSTLLDKIKHHKFARIVRKKNITLRNLTSLKALKTDKWNNADANWSEKSSQKNQPALHSRWGKNNPLIKTLFLLRLYNFNSLADIISTVYSH